LGAYIKAQLGVWEKMVRRRHQAELTCGDGKPSRQVHAGIGMHGGRPIAKGQRSYKKRSETPEAVTTPITTLVAALDDRAFTAARRDLIIDRVARYRIPAVYTCGSMHSAEA
jgi:hypothetical protein